MGMRPDTVFVLPKGIDPGDSFVSKDGSVREIVGITQYNSVSHVVLTFKDGGIRTVYKSEFPIEILPFKDSSYKPNRFERFVVED